MYTKLRVAGEWLVIVGLLVFVIGGDTLPSVVPLLVGIVLGVVAFFPLKPIFLGTSREDPDASEGDAD